jgi:hypothetical protein
MINYNKVKNIIDNIKLNAEKMGFSKPYFMALNDVMRNIENNISDIKNAA